MDPSAESGGAPFNLEEFLDASHAALFGTGLRVALGPFKVFAPKIQYIDGCRRAHEYLDFYVKQALEGNASPSPSAST